MQHRLHKNILPDCYNRGDLFSMVILGYEGKQLTVLTQAMAQATIWDHRFTFPLCGIGSGLSSITHFCLGME